MGEIKSSEEVYQFGKNWKRFLETGFSKSGVDVAQKHILEFLKLDDLQGKIFLDIGCGSGINSMAAFLAGAKKVISFDVDLNSVDATIDLRNAVGSPENWVISHGSALDIDFMKSIECADIVYSWGVLHHTGDMWKAIEYSTIPLKRNGVLYIALYSIEAYQNPSPEYWLDLKKIYNQATDEEKEEMELTYAWEEVLKEIALRGENPFIFIRDYMKNRGMEFWTDVRDWLGGYPMEFASVGEVARFLSEHSGLDVVNIDTSAGNAEYLLRSKDSNNYWDNILENIKTIVLNGSNINHLSGYCYTLDLPHLVSFSDKDGDHLRSPLLLFEDDVLIGFPHATHEYILKKGKGGYSHWGNVLMFSTSDNSDPVKNGREYSIRVPK